MNRNGVLCVLLTSILCACGGGGGGQTTTASTGQTTVPGLDSSTTYSAPTPTVGDYYTYKNLDWDAAASSVNVLPSYSTSVYESVAQDGSFTVAAIGAEEIDRAYPLVRHMYSADWGMSRTIAYGVCTYSPIWYLVPAKLSVGLSWDNKTTRTCGYEPTNPPKITQMTSTGTVAGIESVSVAAGSFETLKFIQIYVWV